MIVKTFEVCDVATFIPVLAVKLLPGCPKDNYLLQRAGYGFTPEEQAGYVGMTTLDGGCGNFTTDPFEWGQNMTLHYAHIYLNKHFDELKSGSVIDVEFILGKTQTPKSSEAQNADFFR